VLNSGQKPADAPKRPVAQHFLGSVFASQFDGKVKTRCPVPRLGELKGRLEIRPLGQLPSLGKELISSRQNQDNKDTRANDGARNHAGRRAGLEHWLPLDRHRQRLERAAWQAVDGKVGVEG
jgi:hypothetical protein